MALPTLGIMALYLDEKRRLEERDFFRRMTIYGKELGLDVFVFTPEDVHTSDERILAHVWEPSTGKWVRRYRSFPDVVFDRCRFQNSPRFQQLKRFRSRYPNLTYMNRPLANKWTLHQLFMTDSSIRPHLPRTRLYRGEELPRFLQMHSVVYLKPINGTGGRGILRVERRLDHAYHVQGRDQSRRILRPRTLGKHKLLSGLNKWTSKTSYLMQQGINLRLPSGRVHDYRLLIQKKRDGAWTITGGAGRIGPIRSITSNLHGGGKAISMRRLLLHWFSATEADQIIEKAHRLCHAAVEKLENRYGALCELALDLAVERSGQIWLIEVNPKPGREVFKEIGEHEIYRQSITRPLEYALYLYEKKNKS